MLDSWLAQREQRSVARLRLPAALAASRIDLADNRCRELQERADTHNNRLLNLTGHEEPALVLKLEERLATAQDQMHHERTALWKDLLPLLKAAHDAGVEAQRTGWLAEFTRAANVPGDRS